MDFDLAGNLEKLTDPLGRITEYSYDELDRPEIVTLPDPPDPKLAAALKGWDNSYDPRAKLK